MYVSRVFIRNFRNFRRCDLTLRPGITCFIGENNSGKSNLIDAVRLVIDGSLSPYRRTIDPEDLSAGLSFTQPEHVLIAVEFSDFMGKPAEEALPLEALIGPDKARLTFRFRPISIVREALINQQAGVLPLKMADYRWELVGGGDDVDLATVDWKDNFGIYFSTQILQQSFLVVLMGALRDVEASLVPSRTSPLQQIVEQRKLSQADQNILVGFLKTANANVNSSNAVRDIGIQLSQSFQNAVGSAFAMSVSLGLGEPTFNDISRALRVLLSGYGMTDFSPSRNGLGLNNILYISMYLSYFEQRIAEGKTAGQLLLIEEPGAHLHPQLQRVLLDTLRNKNVQVFITTHSTHITSGVPLASQVILTNGGAAVTDSVSPALIPQLPASSQADLERYLDATRSSLLFARSVMLVEGPAEQFLIPPLVKMAMGIDLDQRGISVIPIYGTHFAPYAQLFGPQGIKKKCAIVADGDLVPSDSTTAEDAALVDAQFEPPKLESLRNSFVEVFQSKTTFEPEITLKANLEMLSRTAAELGAPRVAKLLNESSSQSTPDIMALGKTVLNTAKRFGKARFAQIASRQITGNVAIPDYIQKAVEWLTQDAVTNS